MKRHARTSLMGLILGWGMVMMANPQGTSAKNAQNGGKSEVTVYRDGKVIELTDSQKAGILKSGIDLLNSCKSRKKRKIINSQISEAKKSGTMVDIAFAELRDFSPAAKPSLRADRLLIPLDGSLKSLIIVSNGTTVYSPFNNYDMELFKKLRLLVPGETSRK